MKTITLDASAWKSEHDFYSALLPELGAPVWHGHNRDGLWDSLVGGSINTVSPPLTVHILSAPDTLRPFLANIQALFREAQSEGTDVQLSIQ